MKSYLACPQTHERRALSLSMDDDAEEDGSEFEGSVILGLKRLPGIYKARKTSHHFSLSKPLEMSHAMERYLASAVSNEPSEPQVDKELPNVPADQPHALAEEPTLDVPGNVALPVPSERDAISALPVPLEASQMPSLNPDRPISVGSERSAPDSGIEDLEAADIYLRLSLDHRLRYHGDATWRRVSLSSMYSRENKIMRKLLGKVTADSSTDTSHTIGITSAPHLQTFRPSASQNAVYPAGVPILCLDTSPDHRTAIIAGRHILKTVVFDGLSVSEGIDVRAAITAQSASSKGASSSLTADQLSIRDVKSGGLTYSPRGAYKCNADGVRQVKWSPKDGFYFACGTESGVVLKWDVRKIAQPLLKIPAHDKACASISWHPDGNHLISGGWDSKCAVWDMSKNADKRQKPRWLVYTPAPVSAVAWRPGLWSASAQGKRAAQVAVSYDDGSHKSNYLETLERELPYVTGAKPLAKRVASIMEQYARAAEQVNQFRLAQTWRILAYSVTLLLNRRAQYHLETRLGHFQKRPSISKIKDIPKVKVPKPLGVVVEMNGEETPRRPSTAVLSNSGDSRSLGVRSLLSDEIESTSNVATPIARAINVEHADQAGHRSETQLPPVMESDSFALPPAAHNVPEPKKKEQKPLDYGPRTPNSRRTLRHDSEESFSQMFSMSESSRQTSGLASSSEGGASTRSITSYPVQLRHQAAEEQGEYESRIRGKEIEDSPEHGALSGLGGPGESAQKDSPEEVFMISQTTMASDTATDPPSQQSQLDSIQPTFEEDAPLHVGVSSSSPPKISPALQHNSSPDILESDYLLWPEDPSYPHPIASKETLNSSPPLNPYTLLTRALDFETRTSALNASAMVLLLKPLMPDSVIDPFRATSILRQQHARLMGMKLFIEAALLRKLCIQGWPEGIPAWGENYTSIFGPAQQGVKGGFMCPSCRKPRELDPKLGQKALWKCERCRAAMAPCAVCGHRETAATVTTIAEGVSQQCDPVMSIWWYCPGCAHGGHATCLQDWHAPSEDGSYEHSDGCCPLDGCGHACLPGKWREEKSTARSDEVGRAAAEKTRVLGGSVSVSVSGSKPQSPVIQPSIRGDNNEVPQSRAVESVREALASSAHTMGIMSSSPVSRSGERERRKSVKFVPTER
nr:WD repeat domain-containing protein [Colletotrichum truncatum]KAF6785828.1 WD repeat domain-containing protein [Colletotrichum truncatum]